MKFKSKLDKQFFLSEINRLDLLESLTDDWQPTDDLVEVFLQSRDNILHPLKDFRKSQNMKQQWRHNRYGLMRGIKNFHKSTEGKRFHRALSDYLVRKTANQKMKDNTLLAMTQESLIESLKAISSLRTHIYIEHAYYHPLNEQIDLQLLSEDVINASLREEARLLNITEKFEEEDIDILLRLTSESDIFKSFNSFFNKNIEEQFSILRDECKYSYPEILIKCLEK